MADLTSLDAGRPSTSSALPGYPRSRKNGGHSGGVPRSAPYSTLEGYPTEMYWTVGQRMERGSDCVERNRSERAKIASVAEWKPPRPSTSSALLGYPRCRKNGGHEPEVPCAGKLAY